jgi:hypothetical protein
MRPYEWFKFLNRSKHYTPIAISPLHRNSGLPPSRDYTRKKRGIRRFPRAFILRRIFYAGSVILLLLTLGVLSSGIPPSFEDIRSHEKALPQHNLTEALAQGRKYLRIPNRVTGHGLNNVLQEAYVYYATIYHAF